MGATSNGEDSRVGGGWLGRYQLRDRIGQGGFATVYRAWDSALSREVALKLLLPHLMDDADTRARFIEEARLLARLRHPNIVTVFDVEDARERVLFTMELIDGVTLSEITAAGTRLPLTQTLDLLRGIGDAVDHLHGAGIIHRDIKPSNVMWEPAGRVVLMDLGIARTLNTSRTPSRELLGTPGVIAPEQIRGEPAGPAADVYALGVMAYQLLGGRPPFEGDAGAVLHAHAYAAPPPLYAHAPGMPDAVYAAIDAAMAKEPAQRPSSARALVEALAVGAEAQPRTSERSWPPTGFAVDTAPRTHQRSVWRARPMQRAGLVGLVTLLVLSAVILGVAATRGEDDKPPATAAVVSDLRVLDPATGNPSDVVHGGDSLTICFGLTPGTDREPLSIVVAAEGMPAGGTRGQRIVARAELVSNRSGDGCRPVPVIQPPLPAGRYQALVQHGATTLARHDFTLLPGSGDIRTSDTFDDPAQGALPQSSPHPEQYTTKYDGGEYVIAKTNPGWPGIPFALLPGDYADAALTVDVRLTGEVTDRYIALGCRTSSAQLDDGYRLSVNVGRGTVTLDRWDRGRFTPLLTETPTNALRRGSQSNRIELRCAGTEIAVSINAVRVAAVEDGIHRHGQLWIGVEADASRRHSVEARFDSLVVYQP
jgi:tRNA A-37 threonylcarbamoyl transferase component Bud32